MEQKGVPSTPLPSTSAWAGEALAQQARIKDFFRSDTEEDVLGPSQDLLEHRVRCWMSGLSWCRCQPVTRPRIAWSTPIASQSEAKGGWPLSHYLKDCSLPFLGRASQTALSSHLNQQIASQCWPRGGFRQGSPSLTHAAPFHMKWQNVSTVLTESVNPASTTEGVTVPWAPFWISSRPQGAGKRGPCCTWETVL